MSEFKKLSKSWRRGFEVAAASSVHSTGPRMGMRMGAALYSGSNLLSVGFNHWFRTHPLNRAKDFEKNVHAEHAALLKRQHYDNPNNLTMYVFRARINCRTRRVEWGCSRPCPNCMNLLSMSNVRRIRFIDENGQPTEMKL